jgi:hypothetical protein
VALQNAGHHSCGGCGQLRVPDDVVFDGLINVTVDRVPFAGSSDCVIVRG